MQLLRLTPNELAIAEAKLVSYVDRSGGESACWNWTGRLSRNGYGQVRVRLRVLNAHRVAWIVFRGEIPLGDGYHGTCVLHSCDNRRCVNPRHLRLGSQLDNAEDRCSRGAKDAGEQSDFGRRVREVRLARGMSCAALGRALGVSDVTVNRWERGLFRPQPAAARRLADFLSSP